MTINVLHNGAQQFTADSLTVVGSVYNFIDNTPPPLQPIYSNLLYPNTGNSSRTHVDITKHENVFGHLNGTDSAELFPARAGANTTILQFPADRTVAIQFTVPSVGDYSGFWGVTTYHGQISDIAISESSTVWPTDPAHVKLGVRVGQTGPAFTTVGPSTRALLQKGHTYYLLLKLHTPGTGTVQAGFNFYSSQI